MSTEESSVVVALEAVAVEEGTAVERTAGRFKRRNDEEKSVVRDHILTAQRRGRCRERMVVQGQGENMLATRIYQRLAQFLMFDDGQTSPSPLAAMLQCEALLAG